MRSVRVGIKIGIGFSQEDDIIAAAEDAATQAKNQLGEDRIDIAFLLTTHHYPAATILPAVSNILNNTRIIGSSTAGIILADNPHRRGIAVMAMQSDTIKFQSIHASHLNLKDLTEAGQTFIKDADAHFGHAEHRLVFFFFDGLLENMSAFIQGIQKEAGEYLPIFAAGSSDPTLFSKTFQYHDATISSSSACGCVWSGDITLHMSRCHGWKPLGKPRLAKGTKKNIIEKIGDAPAFHLYEDFFQNNLGFLKNDAFGKINARYPLGISNKPKQEYLIHNIMDILEDGSIACQDTIKEDSEIHIMIGNKRSCLQSATAAAHDMKQCLKKRKPACLFIVESVMRWQILKRSWKEEIRAITDILGHDIPIFGMLTYGEIFNPGTLTATEKNYLLSGNIMIMAVV